MFRAAAITVLSLVFSATSFAQSGAAPWDPPTALSATRTAAQPAPADGISVGGLFRGLGNDFRHLPSWETAWILGVGAGLSAAVLEQDRQVTSAL